MKSIKSTLGLVALLVTSACDNANTGSSEYAFKEGTQTAGITIRFSDGTQMTGTATYDVTEGHAADLVIEGKRDGDWLTHRLRIPDTAPPTGQTWTLQDPTKTGVATTYSSASLNGIELRSAGGSITIEGTTWPNGLTGDMDVALTDEMGNVSIDLSGSISGVWDISCFYWDAAEDSAVSDAKLESPFCSGIKARLRETP